MRHGGVLPWRTLLLAALALAIYLMAGAAPEAWVYDRVAISHGEWWRLVSAHWVHSDLEHAAWDIGALLVLGLWFEPRLGSELLRVLAVATLGVDLWLWYAEPSLYYYCGLSGILNGVLALGLAVLWRELRHPLVWVTGLAAVAKIMLEIASGQALLTSPAWPSLPQVHGVGFLTGMVLAARAASCKRLVHKLWHRRAATQSSP